MPEMLSLSPIEVKLFFPPNVAILGRRVSDVPSKGAFGSIDTGKQLTVAT
jgi:hypothetical protein